MSAQKKRLHTRIISSIVIIIAVVLVMIPGIENEGVVYGYGAGGGGGGSAAPANQNWGVCVDGNCARGAVNFWGTALEDIWAVFGDVSVFIPEYTKLEGPDGGRLTGFNAQKISDPPAAPEGYEVLAAFNFDPDGATFDPAISINIKFDAEDVASGETPVIAYYNETTGEWEFIEGTIEDGQAVFSMTHCSIYGVLSPAAPAPQPTPTVTPAPAPSDEGGLGTGALIGIIVGVLVVLALAAYLLLGKKYGWKKADQ